MKNSPKALIYLSKKKYQRRSIFYFMVKACPKDNAMFRDAVKTSGNEGRMQVKDIIELVDEAMG